MVKYALKIFEKNLQLMLDISSLKNKACSTGIIVKSVVE